MKISLCMIVKNEEENIINCLDRALGLVDEAIVVDTGSTDKTKDILMDNYVNNNKVKVVEEKWENDFSKARNKSLEYATGNWILVLDADERVFCDRNRLEVFLCNSEELAYKIPIYNIFDKNNF
ncbi:MAG: glycosyltransferase, partial [Lutispora sp.]